jgi:hypothetical protein
MSFNSIPVLIGDFLLREPYNVFGAGELMVK